MKTTLKKWLALFLCAMMVLSSGIFTIGSSLKASEEDQYATASEVDTETQEVTAAPETSVPDETPAEQPAEDTAVTEQTAVSAASSAETGTAEEQAEAATEEVQAKKATAFTDDTATSSSSEEGSSSSEEKTTSSSETVTSSSSEPVEEETDEQKVEASYTYNGNNYAANASDQSVKAEVTLADPSALPDQAEFTVTPVSDETARNAFLQALNNTAAEGRTYDSEHTLIYDLSFLLDKFDEEGKAVEGRKTETEPAAGKVDVTLTFTKGQLAAMLGDRDASEIEVYHLPFKTNSLDTTLDLINSKDVHAENLDVIAAEGVTAAVDPEEKISFTTDSFSVFAVTVNADDPDYEASIGDVHYKTVQEALTAAKSGDTVKVEKDVQTLGTVKGTARNFTIDLNGKTVDRGDQESKNYLVVYSGSEITVTNGTIQNGSNAGNSSAAIYAYGSKVDLQSVTLQNNTFLCGAVFVIKSELTAENCTFTSNAATNAKGGGAICIYDDKCKVQLSGCTFTGNSTTAQKKGGGAIYTTYGAVFNVDNCTFSGNTANNGGAIFSTGGEVNLTGSSFDGNTASVNGGAVYVYGMNKLNATGCTFTNNSAIGGGAVYTADVAGVLDGCTFTSNHAEKNGGAVLSSTALTIQGESEFNGNSAKTNGGAIFKDKGKLTIKDSATFSENTTGSYGGAVSVASAEPDISGATFTGNEAKYGGAVYTYKGKATLNSCKFDSNTASKNGGAVLTLVSDELAAADCEFSNNKAANGGAVYTSSTCILNGNTFNGNHADTNGGAVWSGAALTVEGESSFEGNASENGGGAIFITKGKLTIKDQAAFSGNTAANNGGAVDADHAETEVSGAAFTGNKANLGAAVYVYYAGASVSESSFETNTAEGPQGRGAAIYFDGDKNLEIASSSIRNNTAVSGAVYTFTRGSESVTDTIITGNTATASETAGTVTAYASGVGGYESIDSGSLTISGGAIYGNKGTFEDGLHDLFVKDGNTSVPAASKMSDGDADFSGSYWKSSKDGGTAITRGLDKSDNGYRLGVMKAPDDEKDAVYLDPKDGSDDNSGKSKLTPVKTLKRALELATGNLSDNEENDASADTADEGNAISTDTTVKPIYIMNTVDVTSDEDKLIGAASNVSPLRFIRHSSFAGYLFDVKKSGELNLSNVTVDGNRDAVIVSDIRSLILVEEGAALSLGDGAVLQNNNLAGNKFGSGNNRNFTSMFASCGGAVLNKGDMTMSDGAKITGNSALYGGGVFTSGTFTMNGGEISGNTAASAEDSNFDGLLSNGGGVCAYYDGTFNMEGGSISGNRAAAGGGIAVGASFMTNTVHATLSMTGGSVNGNTAKFNAGGIYIQENCKGTITAGDISSNTVEGGITPYAGGGIYVNGDRRSEYQNAILNIPTTMLVTGNSAESYGGGLSTCPSSDMRIYPNTTAIYGNTGKSGTEFYMDTLMYSYTHYGNPTIFMTSKMLGGGDYYWSQVKGPDGKFAAFLPDEVYTLKDATYLLLTNSPSAEAKAAASGAAVTITGNKVLAGGGGGIGSNGDTVFGQPSDCDTSAKVVKVDSSDASKKLKGVEFTLTGIVDGEEKSQIYTTDDNGEIILKTDDEFIKQFVDTIEGDKTVTLTLKETKALPGYSLKEGSSDTWNVVLDKSIEGDVTINRIYIEGTGSDEAAANSSVTVENTYKANAAAVRIRGTKKVNGADQIKAGAFRFNLLDASGKRIDTAKNDADGNFVFSNLIISEAGVQTYTIVEQEKGKTINGVSYTGEDVPVTITTTDDGEGQLQAEVASGSANGFTITNQQLFKVVVKKAWEGDEDNKDGLRPVSVTAALLKDGKDTGSRAVLTEENDWTAEFDNLEAGDYTIAELDAKNRLMSLNDSNGTYTLTNQETDITTDPDGSKVETVTLTNTYTKPGVTILATKNLTGAELTDGQFWFVLTRKSDGSQYWASNDADGRVVFDNVPYDEKGYSVAEVTESGTVDGDLAYTKDQHVTYDTGAIEYDGDGNITSEKTSFTNTYRPFVLRVQKRSKDQSNSPLVNAVYALYAVGGDGKDIKLEEQTSDENGYMYFHNLLPDSEGQENYYYFKEVSAPEGHEVDPYPGEVFHIVYENGRPAIISRDRVDEDGKPVVIDQDITSKDAGVDAASVTLADGKTDLDAKDYKYSYSDDQILAVAEAADGVLPDGAVLNVRQLAGDDLTRAKALTEEATGQLKNTVAFYDVSFTKDGQTVEPNGSVTVTIQYKDSLAMDGSVDAKALRIVHLKNNDDSTVTPEMLAGTIAKSGDELLETSFTSGSFSTFGIVEPGDQTTANGNYMLTATGVADFVSKLDVAKLDTAGSYVQNAQLALYKCKDDGSYDDSTLVRTWSTGSAAETFRRVLNVEQMYVLVEKSAPDGYQMADPIYFKVAQYDSHLTVYDLKDGTFTENAEKTQSYAQGYLLKMVDVPVEVKTEKNVTTKTVSNSKTVQGEDKIVKVVTVSKTAKNVQTGDTAQITLMIILLAAAGAALAALLAARKKSSKK